MGAFVWNQERRMRKWEIAGLWGLQDQIRYEAQKGGSVWELNIYLLEPYK